MPPEMIPPHNEEAEQAVLGGILIDKDAILKVASFLNSEDFYHDKHRYIYESMVYLFERRDPIDILHVSNRLKEKEQLGIIGGRAYLAELSNGLITASSIANYATIVKRKATLRKLIKAGSDIVGLGFEEVDDVEQILDKAEQELFAVSQRYLRRNFIPITEVLQEAFERIDELHSSEGKLRGLPTGYVDLDNLLAGLQKSNLVILAARPSLGKTTLALDIARHAGVKEKVKVGIFSLEMSKEELTDRLLCAQAGVGLWKMRTGKLSKDDFPAIGHAMGLLSEADIFIDDSATSNIMEIRTKARRLSLEKGLDLMIVDYLQLMEGRSKENRVQEVAEITRALKSIARELNIPVLALSQLSRAVESRSPAIPKLADLRESGTIEQDADVVMFIYRRSADKSRDCPPEERHIAEIHIAKHRNGPTGLVKLFFDEDRVTFKSLDKSR
ncbi:MAG: replicative DNA helicase [Candidatus Jacksonbacteria bacterium RIFOXYC2_FULL_44_29]|nr:MAG: replicative DNA helicase [Candidatus Jacksonbacteria bacterium RIFOXYC2_FULL_44_29]